MLKIENSDRKIYDSNEECEINLYIMPYECYDECIRKDFNLFKRDDMLYQYGNDMFSFYSWDKYICYFTNIIKGFSTDISDYNLKDNFKVEFNGFYNNQRKLLRQYSNSGIKINVKIFSPNNEFLIDSIVCFCKEIGVKEVEIVELNNFQVLPQYFYRDMKGEKRYTNIFSYLYYYYFMTYMDHIMRLIYVKSSNKHAMNCFSIVFSNFFNNLKNDTKKAVKITMADGVHYTIAHKLRDEGFVESEDENFYPVKSWENRVIPEIYGDSTVFKFENSYYIHDDVIDFENILKREYASFTTNELYSTALFEDLFPQPMIAYQISNMDLFVRNEGEIEMYPRFSQVPPNFTEMLYEAMSDITMADDEEVFSVIAVNIDRIAGKIKNHIKNYDMPIGICPSCETNGVIKAKTGYFCLNCNNFALWEKNMVEKVGYFLTKQQMSKLLRPGTMYEARFRNSVVRLYSRENKFRNNERFWDLEVK